MSKYEPRSAEIKSDFIKIGLKVSWAYRNGTLYFSVRGPGPSVLENLFAAAAQYTIINNHVKRWYPNAVITSWNGTKGTFRIKDVISALRA